MGISASRKSKPDIKAALGLTDQGFYSFLDNRGAAATAHLDVELVLMAAALTISGGVVVPLAYHINSLHFVQV